MSPPKRASGKTKKRIGKRKASKGDFTTFKTERAVTASGIARGSRHTVHTWKPRFGEPMAGSRKFFEIEDANGAHTVVKVTHNGVNVRRAPDARGTAQFVAHDGSRAFIRKGEAADVRFTNEEKKETAIDGSHHISLSHNESVDERGRPVDEFAVSQMNLSQGVRHGPKKALHHTVIIRGKPTKPAKKKE